MIILTDSTVQCRPCDSCCRLVRGMERRSSACGAFIHKIARRFLSLLLSPPRPHLLDASAFELDPTLIAIFNQDKLHNVSPDGIFILSGRPINTLGAEKSASRSAVALADIDSCPNRNKHSDHVSMQRNLESMENRRSAVGLLDLARPCLSITLKAAQWYTSSRLPPPTVLRIRV